MELINVAPRVELIAHWVLSPHTEVLSSSEEIYFMKLLVQVFPVQSMGHPRQGIGQIKAGQCELPAHRERIDKKEIPRKRDQTVIHTVGILKVH